MYQAKAMGKGRHHLYDAASSDQRAQRAAGWVERGAGVRVPVTNAALGTARLEPGAG